MDQEKPVENPRPTEPDETVAEPVDAIAVAESTDITTGPITTSLPTENPQIIQPVSTITADKPTSKKPKTTLLIAVAVAILLLGSGAAAYMKFVVNSPDNIWEKALQNTSAGYKEIVEISKQEPAKGGKIEGMFTLSAPIAASGSVEGSWYETNSQVTSNIDAAGVSADIEARTISSDNNPNSADIYFKVDGLDSAIPLIGAVQPELAPIISEVNGNWYTIDSALLASVLPAESSSSTMTLSAKELSDAASKIGVVLDDRLFSVDKTKAVVIVKDSVGREEFNGHDTYKYNVTVQEQQYADFVTALREALKGTALESLSKDLMDKDGTETKMDVDGLLDSVENSDITSYRAETWVDMKLKYIRNIRITPVDKDGKTQGYIDFGLDYSGGDVWPFSIAITTTPTDRVDNKMNATFSAAFNKVSKVTDLGFELSGTIDKQQITGSGKLNISPSNDALKIDKPDGAKSVTELLGLLMGGDSTSLTQTSFDTGTYPIDDVELQ